MEVNIAYALISNLRPLISIGFSIYFYTMEVRSPLLFENSFIMLFISFKLFAT
jgi:hypothetical protein